MEDKHLETLRRQLANAIGGKESHIAFDKVMQDFPPEARGAKPNGSPHSAWELIEHMRIAQRDILDFARDPEHKSPKFPDGYWPKTSAPADEKAWQETIRAFQQDSRELDELVAHADLFAPIGHGQSQTLLREAILVANHNSYELGQVVLLKRMLTEGA